MNALDVMVMTPGLFLSTLMHGFLKVSVLPRAAGICVLRALHAVNAGLEIGVWWLHAAVTHQLLCVQTTQHDPQICAKSPRPTAHPIYSLCTTTKGKTMLLLYTCADG